MPGYLCALLCLGLSVADIQGSVSSNGPSPVLGGVQTISLLASGLLNPIFALFALISLFVHLTRPSDF